MNQHEFKTELKINPKFKIKWMKLKNKNEWELPTFQPLIIVAPLLAPMRVCANPRQRDALEHSQRPTISHNPLRWITFGFQLKVSIPRWAYIVLICVKSQGLTECISKWHLCSLPCCVLLTVCLYVCADSHSVTTLEQQPGGQVTYNVSLAR